MATEKFQIFQINAYMQLLNSRWNLCPAELFPGVWIVESAELFPGVWIVESICSELYEYEAYNYLMRVICHTIPLC